MFQIRRLAIVSVLCVLALAGCGGAGQSALPAASSANSKAASSRATMADVVASTQPIMRAGATTASTAHQLRTLDATVLSNAAPAFSDDFENVAAGASDPNFTVVAGTWNICVPPGASHEYCPTGTSNLVAAGSTAWTDYHVDGYVFPDTGANGIAVLGRMQDSSHFYELELRDDVAGSGTTWWYLWRFDGSWNGLAAGQLHLDGSNYYRLRLAFSGSTISAAASYDGKKFDALASVTDTAFASGYVGLRTWGTAKGRFDAVDVTLDGSSAAPTPAKTPSVPVSGVRYPAGGSYTYFPSSLMLANYSASIDPNDRAWKDRNHITGLDHIRVAAGDGGARDSANAYDPSEPLFYCAPGESGCAKYTMNCTIYTVHCTNGKPFWCPAKAVPQGISDAHVTCIDERTGVVTALWEAAANPGTGGGTWSSGAGAQCSLDGNGQDCGTSAANVPAAVGLIKPEDLLSNAYTLPYAIQAAVSCEAPPTAGVIAPATWGDGTTAGCPPTGQRIFLFGYTAAQIDATSNPEWAKKILRTLLVGSHGIVLTDTDPYAGVNGGGGISIQSESALTYTQFGLANPWKPIFATVTLASGAPAGIADIVVPHDGIDFGNLHFADI